MKRVAGSMILANLAKRCAGQQHPIGVRVVCVMDAVRGGDHGDHQQMRSADRWVPSNPAILSKSACRRNVKLNMTWEVEGSGRVRAMACGVAVVTERDSVGPTGSQTIGSVRPQIAAKTIRQGLRRQANVPEDQFARSCPSFYPNTMIHLDNFCHHLPRNRHLNVLGFIHDKCYRKTLK
jgi:hypothetical protein